MRLWCGHEAPSVPVRSGQVAAGCDGRGPSPRPPRPESPRPATARPARASSRPSCSRALHLVRRLCTHREPVPDPADVQTVCVSASLHNRVIMPQLFDRQRSRPCRESIAQIRKNGRCRRPSAFIRSRTTRLLLSNRIQSIPLIIHKSGTTQRAACQPIRRCHQAFLHQTRSQAEPFRCSRRRRRSSFCAVF